MLETETQALEDARPRTLDGDIGTLGDLQCNVAPLELAKIEREAFLAAVVDDRLR